VPAPESNPPGEFVSEDLRADCARFLEELRVQIEGRVDLPPGSPGWLPAASRSASDPASEPPSIRASDF